MRSEERRGAEFLGNVKTPEGFKKNLGVLQKDGYLRYTDKDSPELTAKGLDYVGVVDSSSLSISEYHENINEIIGPKQAQQFFDLITVGKVHDKDDIIVKLGLDRIKLSGFEKYPRAFVCM